MCILFALFLTLATARADVDETAGYISYSIGALASSYGLQPGMGVGLHWRERFGRWGAHLAIVDIMSASGRFSDQSSSIAKIGPVLYTSPQEWTSSYLTGQVGLGTRELYVESEDSPSSTATPSGAGLELDAAAGHQLALGQLRLFVEVGVSIPLYRIADQDDMSLHTHGFVRVGGGRYFGPSVIMGRLSGR